MRRIQTYSRQNVHLILSLIDRSRHGCSNGQHHYYQSYENARATNFRIRTQLIEIEALTYRSPNPKVSHQFQRQLNALACFKNLAAKNIDLNYCLDLDKAYQTLCLAAFAQINSDSSICEKGTVEIIISNCQQLSTD